MGKASKKLQIVKQTLKFISISPYFEIVRSIIFKAPDAVIRAISNAALNARHGQVAVSPRLKKLFRKH